LASGVGRDAEVRPCLARVRREQKAATKDAGFGAHFTRMYRFSVPVALDISNDNCTALIGQASESTHLQQWQGPVQSCPRAVAGQLEKPVL
jgi:hypothetical protein